MSRRQPHLSRRCTRAALAASVLMSALFVTAAAAAPSPPVLYGAIAAGAPTSDLFRINPATGAATSIGPIPQAVTGLAEDPTTGILYGVTAQSTSAPRDLLTIDPATGHGTIVGSLGATGPTANKITDIAFDAEGRLFGWNRTSDDLARIDKSTAAVTNISDPGTTNGGDGMSFDQNGVLYLMGGGDKGGLSTVNTATGHATAGAALSGSPYPGDNGATLAAGAFACDGSSLYASDISGTSVTAHLVTVDTASGAITDKGPSVDRLDAIEWSCPVEVGFSAASVTVDESAGTATLGVTRTGGRPNVPVTVDFATHDGSAVAAQDYTSKTGSVTIPAGQTTATISVPITNDTAQEAQESFTVTLSNPTAGASLGAASETVNIAANDVPAAKPPTTTPPPAPACDKFDIDDVDSNAKATRLIVELTTYCPGTLTIRATARYRRVGAKKTITERLRKRTIRKASEASLRVQLRLDRSKALKRALRAGRSARVVTRVSFKPATGAVQSRKRTFKVVKAKRLR
jgi:hypothetical protein